MHFLLLGIGLIIAIIFLYRIFMTKKASEIKTIFYSVITVTICIALFYMAVTGRLPGAIAIIAAAWPFIAYWWQKKHQVPNWKGNKRGGSSNYNSDMDTKEALSILGLKPNPTKEEIKTAHKNLMQKIHPDTGGSEGIAQKINEARDILLKNL